MNEKEMIEQTIIEMTNELGTNRELFKKIPHDRLANLASGMFSLCIRMAAVSPSGVSILAITGILHDANSLVKAYNNDQNLKIST